MYVYICLTAKKYIYIFYVYMYLSENTVEVKINSSEN